jgi:hypothetical protein
MRREYVDITWSDIMTALLTLGLTTFLLFV